MKCENMSWIKGSSCSVSTTGNITVLELADSGGYPAKISSNLVMDHSAAPRRPVKTLSPLGCLTPEPGFCNYVLLFTVGKSLRSFANVVIKSQRV